MASQLKPADLATYFGNAYLASVLTSILFGTSIVQGFFYFMHNRDSWRIRSFVISMLMLDIACTALITQIMYFYLIKNFGNYLSLTSITVTGAVLFSLTGVIILGSQLFYADRLHRAISKSSLRWIPALVVCLALATFAFSILEIKELFSVNRLISKLSDRNVSVPGSLNTLLGLMCDLAATIGMCLFLSAQHSEYRQTKAIVNSLLHMSIHRGVLVTLVQLCWFATFLAQPTELYWLYFQLSLSKLHMNTLLAMLNSRVLLRYEFDSEMMELENTLASELNMASVPCTESSTRSSNSSEIRGDETQDTGISDDVSNRSGKKSTAQENPLTEIMTQRI